MMIHKIVHWDLDGCHIFTNCGIFVAITTEDRSPFQNKKRVGALSWPTVTCKNCLKTKE